ncbi:dimethylargininase [Planctomonas psychrotolerans]|uniref:dimethylargininase n=1 Tax=Planctomonas psychrotolerans TaxID=2528712 RepID=UPI0029D418DC|nr:dimethylargininase [Planctomonas psychrotolerans]
MTHPAARSARPLNPTAEPSFGRAIAAALIAALGVALVAHAANTVAFFIGGGNTVQVLGQVSRFFMLSSVFAFVLLFAFAALGAFRRWPRALVAGFVSSLVGSLLATTLSITSTGQPLSGDALAFVGASIVTVNLVFILAYTITAATLGRRLWQYALGYRAPADVRSKTALVRVPATTLADGLRTHIEHADVDGTLADEQWERYVAAFEENGWKTREVPAAADLPDSVFVEDIVVLFGNTAVLTSPGALSRRGEKDGVEEAVRELGFEVESIELPGTLDGGDVLTIGDKVYVGRSGRTNGEGIAQLRTIVGPLGYRVIPVPVTKTLHLKSQVTALPDGTVLGFPASVDDPALFDRFFAVPEPTGAAVVVLDPGTLLISASAPETAARLADLGYRVVQVDISEFEKLEGCVTCLSVRIP